MSRPVERYSACVACSIGRLNYRRLDYLIRSGFFTPDLPAAGKATDRGFSFRDLLALRCIGDLREAGVSLQAVREVDHKLRKYGSDFARAHLVVSEKGHKREVYVKDREALIALLRQPGQLACATILDLGQCETEVREIVAHESKTQEHRKAKAA